MAAPPAPSAGRTAADQPYQALYRRYRPQRFADVRGQEHVTRALRNAVREGRVAHAYLFSGPRGTGKTSTARILAMGLNCQSPDGGEPDGKCLSCTAIRAGASMDVFELDAASNRRLEEMRDLLSRVALGTPGRWKVYIIDEVHQLTGDAASALLKTLEEPPSHVVFVLATTDPQKVLPTILSRTQHFEFRLLDGDVLTDLLTDINQDAGLALPSTSVRLAVQRGRGSARDAESALEQLAASGGDEDEGGLVAELAEGLAERDVSQTLQAVARAVMAGREPRRLGNDLLEHLRNAFLSIQAPSLVLLPGVATPRLTENARQMGLPLLVRAMETVGEALVDMRDSVDPRVTLEVALIRLVSPSLDPSPGAILERVERLERALTERTGPSPTGPSTTGPSTTGATPISPSSVETAFGGTVQSPGPVTRPGPGTFQQARSEGQRPPSAGPVQAKVALGAFLRAGGPAGEDMPAPAGPSPAVPPLPSLVAAPAPDILPSRHDVPGRGPGTAALPSRDELTKAWGDTVLSQLSQPAKVYLAGGRFVEVANGAAVFGLPAEGLLARAKNFQAEAESALAAHFGRAVPLRLVLDKRPGAAPGPIGPPPASEETYDLDEMGEMVAAPPLPEVPAEQRILQAFPGSVLEG
jgi:DNA polymerase-3 subunit gamma/tau